MRSADASTTGVRPDAPSVWAAPYVWEWVRVIGVAGAVAWPLARLGGFLPGTRAETAALVAGLLALHLIAPSRGSRRAHPAGWLLLPFLAYAAANAAWVTPVRWLGWMDWAGWAEAAAVYWVVLNGIRTARCRRALVGALVLLASGSAVAALYQRFVNPAWLPLGRTQATQFLGRSSGTFGVPNSLGGLAILLLPAAGVLAFDTRLRGWLRGLAAAGAVLIGAALVLSISRGAWLGLGLALAALPLIFGRGSLARRLALAAGIGLAGAALAAGLCAASPAVRGRIKHLYTDSGEKSRPILWRAALGITRDNPWLGGGAGSFNTRFDSYRPASFQDEPVWAHNDYLNTLADYGGVGFVLLAGAVAVTVGLCRRRGPAEAVGGPSGGATDAAARTAMGGGSSRAWRVALGTGLLAFALQLAVDFHLKIPALALAFGAVAGVAVGEAWRAGEGADGDRACRLRLAINALVAAAVVAATAQWVYPRFKAEGMRWLARDRINKMANRGIGVSGKRSDLEDIRGRFSEAVKIDPGNGQAWSDLAYADCLLAPSEPGKTSALGAEAQSAAERAIALCPIQPEFWVRKGAGLDMQGRWDDGGEAVSRALELAPNRVDLWYYQAFHLSLNADDPGPALAAIDFCLRLDPGYRLAQVLRQRLATADSNSR